MFLPKSVRFTQSPMGLLVAANLLLPISLLIFAYGFFPYKAFLPGSASLPQNHISAAQNAPFDKVIFMVVDALRSDFVYSHGSGFAFTQHLIRTGSAIPFTAYAASPTITMPRIKAITTGSLPSFLDVILNFAESHETSNIDNQDNWLVQLKARPGGRLIMYGDDTWLKLFPTVFSRADGTSSFFVSDFSEVDNNVTRHIPEELKKDDWNGMIMHFLGLDHIGHKLGPKSYRMIPKQKEMDEVVHQIYQAMETEQHLLSALLVLCGDHGMNEAGNHGGSAESETSPALVFISPKLRNISEGRDCPTHVPEGTFQYYNSIQQSDIVPTLAALLGLPIPLNNLGVLIPQFLRFWSPQDSISIMQQNAEQLFTVTQASFNELSSYTAIESSLCDTSKSDEEKLACLWHQTNVNRPFHEHDDETSKLLALLNFSNQAQRMMSGVATKYETWKLYVGISTAFLAVLIVSQALTAVLSSSAPIAIWFSLVTIGYGSIMFASSYVEEEQQFWYWVTFGWLGWLVLKSTRQGFDNFSFASGIFISAILRLIRSWNQTGQKHAGEGDISRDFLHHHNFLMWSAILATYLGFCIRIIYTPAIGISRSAFAFTSTLSSALAFVFKVAFTVVEAPELLAGLEPFLPSLGGKFSLITQARIAFLGLALLASLPIIVNSMRSSKPEEMIRGTIPLLHNTLSLFLMTQSRTVNIPLFLLFQLQANALAKLNISARELTLTSLLFQFGSFFAFGGSNSISSVDLSNAYNGISGYNIAAVGILTFCGNWAGPIWWTSATLSYIMESNQAHRSYLMKYMVLMTTFITCSSAFTMLACTLLRSHLFVWTVFSPKYLYSIAWGLGQHLCVNVGLCIVLLLTTAKS